MPTNNIRWATATRIRDLALRSFSDDTGVTLYYPGDAAGPGAVWLDPIIRGTVDIPVATAGRKNREDDFTLLWHFRVRGLPDADDAVEAVGALGNVFEDLLADDPGLDDLDGVIAAMVSGEMDGPSPFEFANAGWAAYMSVPVAVMTRLT